MTQNASLIVQFNNFWHAGTGLSAGTHTDALTDRNHQGLPFVSGRHLKGMLRHALHRAEQWGWLNDETLPEGPAKNLETLIFGSASQQEQRHNTLPGILAINDAGLSSDEVAWLAHDSHAEYRAALYEQLFSTAIDENGSAKEQTLRSIEVALPMTLRARITLAPTSSDPAHRKQQQAWLDQSNPWAPIEAILCLVDSLGAKRTRGLGEAVLTLEQQGKRS